jgi:translocation protein SEC63
MTDYNYDDTGAIFNFFLLTLLGMLLIPYTFSGKKKKRLPKDCNCSKCLEKFNRKELQKTDSSVRYLILGIGWVLFTIFLYRTITMEIVEEKLWDPFEILGISEGESKSKIKKAFRALSLKFHPDKVLNDEKEEAEKKFVDISKAYKILTDEEAKKKFDETGNPDGTETYKLGLALPKWLVEKDNNMLVLFLYALIFGLGMPFAVVLLFFLTLKSRWWSQANLVNLNKIMNSTMAVFYRDLKENSVFRGINCLIQN